MAVKNPVKIGQSLFLLAQILAVGISDMAGSSPARVVCTGTLSCFAAQNACQPEEELVLVFVMNVSKLPNPGHFADGQ